MRWEFDNDRPIYIQLVEKLKLFIISGQYEPGSRMLSVRDLALEAKVNPNTMQKALGELENLGLIYTQRTSGKYVTEDKKLISKFKDEMALDKVHTYLNDMKSIGFSKKEAMDYLKMSKEE